MANIYVAFSCFTAFLTVFMGIYVYNLDPKSRLNRVFSIYSIVILFYNIGFVISHFSFEKNWVRFWYKFSAVSWCFYTVMFLFFILEFTGKLKKLKSYEIFLIILPSIIFYIKEMTGDFLVKDFYLKHYIWHTVRVGGIWGRVFLIYNFLYIIIATVYVYVWYGRNKHKNNLSLKQLNIIILSAWMTALGNIIVSSVTSFQQTLNVPPLSHFFSFFWLTGVWYAVIRYRFMALTPTLVSDEILSRISNYVILLNHENRIALINQALLKETGFQENDIVGLNIHHIIPDKIENWIDESIKNRQSIHNIMLDYNTDSQEHIPTVTSVEAIFDNAERYIGTLIIGEDIRYIKKLEHAKNDAIKANNDKNEFINKVTHDLKAPLTVIMGMTELMVNRNPNPNHIKFHEKVLKASRDLLILINTILDVSNIETGKLLLEKMPFSLKEVIENLNLNGLKNIKTEFIVNEKIPPVIYGDRYRVNQIFELLINNSLKFREDGVFEFKINMLKKENNKILVGFSTSGNSIYAVNNESLGYFIAKELIRKMNGKLSLENSGENVNIMLNLEFEIRD
ncbi:MAG: histidine kinase N-terminal 7TM domain-containing protein [Candidatus Muiribacteriota bacterium]